MCTQMPDSGGNTGKSERRGSARSLLGAVAHVIAGTISGVVLMVVFLVLVVAVSDETPGWGWNKLGLYWGAVVPFIALMPSASIVSFVARRRPWILVGGIVGSCLVVALTLMYWHQCLFNSDCL